MDMQKKKIQSGLAIILVAAVVCVVGFNWYKKHGGFMAKSQTPSGEITYVNEKGERWTIPKGKAYLKISSGEGTWPRLTEATIDPLDVKMGDTQKMTLTLEDKTDIKSVVADIETDMGTVSIQMTNSTPNDSAKKSDVKTVKQYTYTGSWLVKDTHEKVYHTIFTATNKDGKKTHATLAWSDPLCVFSNSNGNGVLSGNCSSSDVIGWDGGNETIPSGATLILGSGSTLVWTPGRNLNINNGGTIVNLNNGGKMQQGYLFYKDVDGDLRSPTSHMYFSTSSTTPTGFVRVNSAAPTILGFNDCEDGTLPGVTPANAGNPNVYGGNTNFYSAPFTPAAGGSPSYDYSCNGGTGGATGYPGGGQCDDNSNQVCSATVQGVTYNNFLPDGQTGFTAPVSCGQSGTYVVDPGSVCGGVACITQTQTANCKPYIQQYTQTNGVCDSRSNINLCSDPAYVMNGTTGWVGSTVPACGASAQYVVNPGDFCNHISCVTQSVTQACH